MKFLVVVNQKYIVAVDAETNGGAEHKVLDLCGMHEALAFDPVTESCLDIYKSYIESCEWISWAELCNKANNALADRYEHMNALLRRKHEVEDELDKLNERRKQLSEELVKFDCDIRKFQSNGYYVDAITMSKDLIYELRKSNDFRKI